MDNPNESVSMPKLALDLTVFAVMMLGSLAGALALLDVSLLLGYFALLFAFGYMAWQFESFGRIREHRLLLNRRRVFDRRSKGNRVAHILRAGLVFLAFYLTIPGVLSAIFGAVVSVALALYLFFVPSKLVIMVDSHEAILRDRRLAHLAKIEEEHS